MSAEINAARASAAVAAEALQQSKAFRQLTPATQNAIVRDLSAIRNVFEKPLDPYALGLQTPEDFQKRLRSSPSRAQADSGEPATSGTNSGPPAGPRVAATRPSRREPGG
jgi:hypothetical protein